ncbi:MAG TPA: hypothetical protein DDZ80_27420 [Cyanobacteria bacterium UBA8803]|nr:hypothetical protein [Cyanobacteria bacterium UBA9273]HBL62003.1 hypothetical protein [Cyanobacteria bacterium UBA8803]
MYKQVKKPSSSWSPTVQKKPSKFGPQPYKVQPKLSQAPKEMPAYTPLATDWITDNPILRSLEAASAPPQEESEGENSAQLSTESETIQRQAESAAHDTPSPRVQRKLTLDGLDNEYQPEVIERANPVLNGLNQFKVQRQEESVGEELIEQPVAGEEVLQRQEESGNTITLPPEYAERVAQIETRKQATQSQREVRDKLKADLSHLPKASTEENKQEIRDALEQEKIIKGEIVTAENYLIELLGNEIAAIDEALKDIYKILPNKSGGDAPKVSSEVWAGISQLEKEKKEAERERLTLKRGHVRDEIRAIEEKLKQLPVANSKERKELEDRKKELGEFLSSTAETRTSPGTVGKDLAGQGYVVYQNEVKVGGALPWRNNNPGNVTIASNAEGVIGFNPEGIGFVVFKDWESGVKASGKWWDDRKTKSPGDNIENAILIYSQGLNRSEKALKEADKYNEEVESWTGLKRTRTLGSLSEEELAQLKLAILRKEGGLSKLNVGTSHTCASTSSPLEYRHLLGCDN